MKNANEMRTIANNYNARSEINLADDVICRKAEEIILTNAVKGKYIATISAETLATTIRCGMQNGNEIVERAKNSGVLERTKQVVEANGYKAEVFDNYKIVIRWNIEK